MLYFTVFAVCNALKASRIEAGVTPRVHRWLFYMQSFEFGIE